ncbi:MAG TPA: pyridoxine 5'-phosphate synthase [Gammaproteobacteria bacterium]|nr:pyridoxine 5'-phosphate synthase [Gammaproteobacteria bacterium]
MSHLGVNIDHIATLRQARGSRYPDPVQAAFVAEQAGANSITIHLREDRRHIQDRDVKLLHETLQTKMNLEMAITAQMLDVCARVGPDDCCLVPENRQELTTEGGLDVVAQVDQVSKAVVMLSAARVRVSLFIDPEEQQILAAQQVGAAVVELHTGRYADAPDATLRQLELTRLIEAARFAASLGLQVNAGHGLHYHNVTAIAAIAEVNELNIGHAIIARALFVGLDCAVREMKALLELR